MVCKLNVMASWEMVHKLIVMARKIRKRRVNIINRNRMVGWVNLVVRFNVINRVNSLDWKVNIL